MIDACILTTLIEMLFPQETVFNCFGVAVTFLQWKVPKTGLCFEAVQRNGKMGLCYFIYGKYPWVWTSSYPF